MKQCKICLNADSCSFDWRDPDCEYMNCTEFKKPPLTNADCIRTMSDEELAKWMVREQINGIYAFLKGLEDDDLLHDFVEEINLHGAEEIKKEKLGWLKQECER